MNIYCNSINEATYRSCREILNHGKVLESRTGTIVESLNVDIILQNPENRHLHLQGRNNNIFAVLAEIFWVMAGEEKLDPFLSFFIPRAKEFSDDGGLTWSDAYGPRIYKDNQIDNLIRTFEIEGKNTRRGILSIYHSEFDSDSDLREDGKINCIPCNDICFYYVRENKFYSKVVQRSSDAIWGMSAANLPEFTVMQEIFLQLLKNNIPEFKEVGLGTHTQSIVSFHLYNPGSGVQAEKIVKAKFPKKTEENFPLLLGDKVSSQNDLMLFFGDLYEYFNSILSNKRYHFGKIDDIFYNFGVPPEKNSLYSYAKLIEFYITKKLNIKTKTESWEDILSPDLLSAVSFSKFNLGGLFGKERST